MKKRIIAIILLLTLTLSIFSGCTLIEKDETKVLAQAVVTIGSGELAREVSITDIVSSYNSVAYIYIYYYGMSADDVLTLIINSQVSTQAFIYAALNEMDVLNSSDNVLERYLTDAEIAEVKAEVDALISAEIQTLEKEALQTVFEENGGELTAITSRKYPDWANISTTVPMDFVGTDSRKAAYDEFEKEIISYGYTMDEMYEMMYEVYLETKITEKFTAQITADFDVSVADIKTKYTAQLADEIEYYSMNGLEDYMTKYDTDTNSVIYNPSGEEFGYVKQILVSFTDEEKSELEGLEGDALAAKRMELAGLTTATDMRDSWLYSYGYDTSENGLFSSYDYDGTVTATTVDGVQILDEEGNYAYSTVTPNEYVGYDAFITQVMNPYLGGTLVGYEDGQAVYKSTFDNDKLDDLIYAYNEDSGVFGVEYGYLVPNDSFYEEFNVSSQILFDYGVGAYTVSFTDYGYHIIYLTKLVSADEYNQFVESEMNTVGTFSYEFATLFEETASSAYQTEKVSEYTDMYNTEEYIVLNEDAYAEMISYLS